MKNVLLIIGVFGFSLFYLTNYNTPKENYEILSEQGFETVDVYIQNQLAIAITNLNQLKDSNASEERIILFKASRLAFKKAEPFAAYISPENSLRVNGPPLPVFKEDNKKILPPIGFQALEELLYSTNPNDNDISFQIKVLLGYLNKIRNQLKEFPINESRLFPAIHQQFLRIYALSLTGFDTPISLIGIEESIECLKSLGEVYRLSLLDSINTLNPQLNTAFLKNIHKASEYLSHHNDFNTLDRYTFGRNFLNPLTSNWSEIAKTYGYVEKRPLALNIDAPTFFEKNSFNLNFFRSAVTRNPSEAKIKLGELLFKEKALSHTGSMSCFTCHDSENAYQDGLETAIGEGGISLKRNTPTLLNSIFQKKFFWDGRADELEHQIANVFDNENEFNNNVHSIQTSKILNDEEYVQAFEKA